MYGLMRVYFNTIYLTMNNTGKTFIAIFALVTLLGLGWFLIHRDSDQTADMAAREALEAAKPIDPSWLAEMDASVRLVQQMLLASGNVRGAITMIEVLDLRAARQEAQVRLAPLRRAFAADKERLKSLSSVDLVSTAATIDQLVLDVDAMTLISASRPLNAPRPSPTSTTQSLSTLPGLGDIVAALKARFADIVRIRKVENPEAVFLTPEQGALITERLRLRLVSARIALLSRQEKIFAQDLTTAERILNTAFDPDDEKVVNAKKSIGTLKSLADSLAIPMSLESLGAIEQLKGGAQ